MSNEQLPEEVMKAIRDFVDNIRGSYTYGEVFWAASFGYRLRDEEVRRLREALEEIANDEGEACQRCEGNGKLWADGKAHLPSHNGALINCGECGGSGRIHRDLQDIAYTALQQTSKIENNG